MSPRRCCTRHCRTQATGAGCGADAAAGCTWSWVTLSLSTLRHSQRSIKVGAQLATLAQQAALGQQLRTRMRGVSAGRWVCDLQRGAPPAAGRQRPHRGEDAVAAWVRLEEVLDAGEPRRLLERIARAVPQPPGCGARRDHSCGEASEGLGGRLRASAVLHPSFAAVVPRRRVKARTLRMAGLMVACRRG